MQLVCKSKWKVASHGLTTWFIGSTDRYVCILFMDFSIQPHLLLWCSCPSFSRTIAKGQLRDKISSTFVINTGNLQGYFLTKSVPYLNLKDRFFQLCPTVDQIHIWQVNSYSRTKTHWQLSFSVLDSKQSFDENT